MNDIKEYSNKETYEFYSLCSYEGKNYICFKAVEEPEEFDSSKWVIFTTCDPDGTE